MYVLRFVIGYMVGLLYCLIINVLEFLFWSVLLNVWLKIKFLWLGNCFIFLVKDLLRFVVLFVEKNFR